MGLEYNLPTEPVPRISAAWQALLALRTRRLNSLSADDLRAPPQLGVHKLHMRVVLTSETVYLSGTVTHQNISTCKRFYEIQRVTQQQ
jgi:hypothetical protein